VEEYIFTRKNSFEVCIKQTNERANKNEKCTNGRCITCSYIDTEHTFVESTITKNKFSIICASENEILNCNSTNVVYVIACNKCNVQYVGETSQKLKERFLQHQRNVKNRVPGFMYDHFCGADHSYEDMKVKIIEQVKGETKSEIKANLLKSENFWIRMLITAYPFGFNDRISKFGDISNSINPVGNKNHPYFNFATKRKNRARGRRGGKHRRTNEEVWATVRAVAGDHNLRKLYVILKTFSRSQLNNLYLNITSLNRDIEPRVKLAIQGYYAAKCKTPASITKDKVFAVANYVNKGIEMVHPEKILNYASCRRLIPKINNVKPIVIISYKCQPPVSLRLFNYSKEIRGFNEFKATNNEHCDCATNPFKSSLFGHVYSGELGIVKHKKLRELFTKGSKYREPRCIDFDQVVTSLYDMIRQLAAKLANRSGLPIENLDGLVHEFQRLVQNKIQWLRRQNIPNISPVLTNSRAITELRRLQNTYIIVPADKAANNYVFICKKFYFENIYKEFGIEFESITQKFNIRGNQTYQYITKSYEDIVAKHISISKQSPYFHKVKENEKNLPIVFATPKIHKLPNLKFRFIASSKNSSLRKLNSLIYSALSCCKTFIKNYCNTIKLRMGINCYWSIDNNSSVIEYINRNAGIEHATSYDFSTLFTSLPHKVILSQLFYGIDLMYKNSGSRNILAVNEYKTFFTNTDTYKGYKYFNSIQMKELIETVLNETYVTFGNLIFRQTKGVPIGGQASAQISDLTLSILELKFLSARVNRDKAYKLAHVFRYIDDILVCKMTAEEFDEIAKLIYPSSLPIEKSCSNNIFCNYLDLKIVLGNPCIIKLYDKTVDFNFNVVKFVFADSNIHSKIGANVLLSQLLRYARICTNIQDFVDNGKALISTAVRHGFKKTDVDVGIDKLWRNHSYALVKFSINTRKKFSHVLRDKI